MTIIVEITPTRFRSGTFDSDKRYLRKVASGGSMIISAGRTWQIGDFATDNTGTNWLAFRFDNGVHSIAHLSTTIGGFTQTRTVDAVTPRYSSCAIE